MRTNGRRYFVVWEPLACSDQDSTGIYFRNLHPFEVASIRNFYLLSRRLQQYFHFYSSTSADYFDHLLDFVSSVKIP